MFCDLVGSTALSTALDAEDLRELIHGFQAHAAAIVEEHGGFVARYMGDGLLVYFGYPVAHEDDAVRAIRGGLDLIARLAELSIEGVDPDLMARLSIRVGIATGQVIVGDLIGKGGAEERSVVGETPNLAARVQAAAKENTVAVSATTHALARDRFEFESLGSHDLKGLSEPVQLWQPTMARARASRFDRHSDAADEPIVGREQETGLLLERYRAAGQGAGQVVFVLADAGMGKSRLVRHLATQLEPRPAALIGVQAAVHDQSRMLRPFFDTVAARAEETGRGESQIDRMANELGPAVDEKRYLLEEYLGGVRNPKAEMVVPDRVRADALDLFEGYVERLAEAGPVVLLVEDAQWLDSASIALLQRLGSRAETLPLFLLVTARRDFDFDAGKYGRVTQLGLNRLNADQCRRVAERLAGGRRLPDELVSAIVQRSDGVPLFVEEITRTVLSSDAVETTDDEVVLLRPVPEHDIPSTLQDSLMARLDRLGSAKQVAQWAAVFGRDVSRDQLLQATGYAPVHLDPWLEELTDGGVMIRLHGTGGGTYGFRHTLVRDIAYGSLLRKNRQQMHATIVRLLEDTDPGLVDTEPERLAYHHTGAGHGLEAARLWCRAAENAQRQGMMIEAADHYERALRACRQATDEDRHRREVELLVSLGWITRQFGALERTQAAFDEAERIAEEHGIREPLPRLYVGRGNLNFLLGDMDACEASHRRALELARELDSPVDEARALGGLGDAYQANLRIRGAMGYLERCIELSTELECAEVLVPNHPMVAWVRFLLGEPAEAERWARESLVLAQKHGHRRAELLTRGIIVFAIYTLGRADEALAAVSETLELCKRMHSSHFLMFNLYIVECLRRRLGEPSGLDDLERQYELVKAQMGARGRFVPSMRIREISDRDRRRELIDDCMGSQVMTVRGTESLFVAAEAAEGSAVQGDWEYVDRVGAWIEESIDREECPWVVALQGRIRALRLLAAGHPDAPTALRTAEADELRFFPVSSIQRLAEQVAGRPWSDLMGGA